LDSLSYKTRYENAGTVTKNWVVVDANSQILGRFATQVAMIIRGKNKPGYTPNVDCGDNVVVINAEKIRLTGDKMQSKVYTRHTGHPGGQRFTTPRELMEKNPAKIIEKAVRGMLPKNRLGRRLYTNLHVYTGSDHPHTAQQPKEIKLSL